ERPKYEAFGELLKIRLEAGLKPLGIWFEVSARAKELDSLVKKMLLKRHYTFDNLPDKVGVRVIVRYRSDLQIVIESVTGLFDCGVADDKHKGLGADRLGYQNVHLDQVRLRASDDAAIEYSPTSFWAELQ